MALTLSLNLGLRSEWRGAFDADVPQSTGHVWHVLFGVAAFVVGNLVVHYFGQKAIEDMEQPRARSPSV